jgi:uncharacterized protein YndB with AHSA1/START domain
MPAPQPTQTNPEFLLQIRRTLHASRERVFAAWAERDQLERWMCKDVAAHQVIHHEQDIRPGGHWLIEVRDTAKKQVYWGSGTYLAVKPPEKLVFTWSWSKEPPKEPPTKLSQEGSVSEVTVEFFARGDKTDLVLTHRGLDSLQSHKEHETGWNGCFDELEKTLD